MKKIYFLLCGITMSITQVFSQNVFNEHNKTDLTLPKSEVKVIYHDAKEDKTLHKAGRSGWLSPVSLREIEGASFDQSPSFLRLFPDSFTSLVSSEGELFNAGFHGLGTAFDPVNPLYSAINDEGWSLNIFDSYNVDSIRFSYVYVRETDQYDGKEVVDTAFLYYFDNTEMNLWTFQDRDNLGGFSIPFGLNTEQLAPTRYTYVDTILLTKALATDTVREGGTVSIQRLVVDIPEELRLNEYNYSSERGGTSAGAYLVYKPGIPYSFGDTIISFNDTVQLETQFNDFGLIGFGNIAQEIVDIETFNNSFVTNFQVRYGQTVGSLTGFMPFIQRFGWTRDVYIDFDFFISEPEGEEWASVEEFENITFGVYPNPISTSQSLKADFNLVNAEVVVIELYDILGNKVKEVTNRYYSAGEHQIDASITDLTPGMYIYSVKAGNAVSTKKISVID